MAFATQTAVIAAPAAFQKASAFINLYVPNPAGGRHKVGAIPLKDTKKYEAALIKRFSEDPEAAKKMLSVLEIDFQLVTEEPVAQSDLGF